MKLELCMQQEIEKSMNFGNLTALSVGIIGLGLLPAFGYLAVFLILVAGTYFLNRDTVRHNWIFLFLFNQYFILATGLNIFHDGDWITNPNNPFYALMIAFSVPLVALYEASRKLQSFVFYPLAIGIIMSVALLIWQFFGPECRVMGYTFNPLGTSALFLIVAFVLLSLGQQIGGSPKFISWVILGLVIYVILGPAGSRMPFFSGMVGVFLYTFYLLRVDGFKGAMFFILTTFAVFTFSIAISVSFKDCGIKQRLIDNFTTVRLIFQTENQIIIGEPTGVFELQACDGAAEIKNVPVVGLQSMHNMTPSPVEQINSIGMPSSEGFRFILWLSVLKRWQHQKLLGYGQSNEQTALGLSCTGQPHSHNQLLSWLVSGGLLLLLSGLIFVSASIVTSENVLLAFLTLAPVAASQLTDSLLNLHPMIVSISVALPAVLMFRRVG